MWCYTCTQSILDTSNFIPTEYDALRRLGIDDPKGYVARRYCATSGVEQLESCAVGEMVLKELEGAVEDIHTSEMKWIDVVVRFLNSSHGDKLSTFERSFPPS